MIAGLALRRGSCALLPLALVLMLLFLPVFLPGPGWAEETLKIALVGPYSGNFSFLGACMEQGARLAIDPFSAKGGILGKKIELVIEDNQSNPGITTQKMMKVIEKDKVDFVLVGGGTSCAISAFEVAKREKVLTFSVDANDNSLNGEKANRYSFHIPIPNHEWVQAVAPSLLERFGRRWYFHTSDYKWGWDMSANFKKFLKEKGGEVVGEDLIPMETKDFSAYIINVKNAKPDVLICLVVGMAGITAQLQYHEFGLDKYVKRTNPAVGLDERLFTDYEVAKESPIMVAEWDSSIGAPGCKELYQEYRKKFPLAFFPVPVQDVYHAYIATRETLRVMAEVKSTRSSEVIKGLEGRTIKDSLTHSPAMIRGEDHQYVRDVYVFDIKPPGESKHKGDWIKPVKRIPWQKLFRPPSIRLNQEPLS